MWLFEQDQIEFRFEIFSFRLRSCCYIRSCCANDRENDVVEGRDRMNLAASKL